MPIENVENTIFKDLSSLPIGWSGPFPANMSSLVGDVTQDDIKYLKSVQAIILVAGVWHWDPKVLAIELPIKVTFRC